MSEGTDSHLIGAKLRAARARFAESLGARADGSSSLGSIVLRPDQLDAIRRARDALARDGGCLLADDPGTGKTYVALAVAREWRAPLVVAPASLLSTWHDAMRRAGTACAVMTHEALSRGSVPSCGYDGIVVDESHRFRPTSRRHAALAGIASHAPILLLSATPLQNRPRELAAQIALFVGESAYHLSSAALARYVVRSASSNAVALPRVAPPRWLDVRADDGDVLRAILALPPPPRAIDAGDGGALLAIALVRAWASSRAALVATLLRRRRTLVAIEQCLEEGRAPSRRELRAWSGGDGVQLGFASLLATSSVDRDRAASLRRSVAAERRGLDAIRDLLAARDDPDAGRVSALRGVRVEHRGASVLAFSESAATVRAYFRLLRGDPQVAMLSAGDARIASGRISRGALLARFAPNAQGVRAPPERERVTLLLSTDLLSEGVNLQDASVVVHLDLPWNPARLAQRLGRVRRPGGAPEVFSYLMTPPAESSLLLRAESRLRVKLECSERTIGRGLDVLPSSGMRGDGRLGRATLFDPLDSASAPMSEAELRGSIHRILASWARANPRSGERARVHSEHARCVVAGATSEAVGWLAVLDDGRIATSLRAQHDLITSFVVDGDAPDADADRVSWADSDPTGVEHALRIACGEPRMLSLREIRDARSEVSACVSSDWTRATCGEGAAPSALARMLHRRLAAELRSIPRHRRAQVSPLATRLVARLDEPMPLGVERAIVDRCDESARGAQHGGERWISDVLALLERAPGREARDRARRPDAVAIIVFGPGGGAVAEENT